MLLPIKDMHFLPMHGLMMAILANRNGRQRTVEDGGLATVYPLEHNALADRPSPLQRRRGEGLLEGGGSR